MKYIIRALVAIPVVAVGVSVMLCITLSLDYWVLIPLGLALCFAFISGLDHYEEEVEELTKFIKERL